MSEIRTLIVKIEIHDSTYPDPGALTGEVERCLTDGHHGLGVIAVHATEAKA